jgi:4-alpha-glucanotransferase/alpha-amylase
VLDDRHMQGSVVLRFEPPAGVTARPYHTVSQSEEGFERVMQSVTLDIAWPVADDGASFAVHLTLRADVP